MSRTARFLPLLLVGLAVVGALVGPPQVTRVGSWLAAFFVAVQAAALLRGRERDAAVMMGSVLFGLALIELGAGFLRKGPIASVAKSFTRADGELGWRLADAGSFAARKVDPGDGAVIFDQTYTIADGQRKTTAREDGPTVAFVGDSFTFGEGLADAQTLPQIFADANSGKIRVLNLGVPGYGPQQVLRALETGRYDPLFGPSLRAIVFETSAWHADRAACKLAFTARAPRYVLNGDGPHLAGHCQEGLTGAVRTLLGGSALFERFVWPAVGGATRAEIDLYLAMLARSARLAQERYHAPFVIAYIPAFASYLERSGYTNGEIVDRLRAAGLDVVDLPFEQGAYPGHSIVIERDGHPSAFINRVWADALKRHLDERHIDLTH